jgi:para-nitrobenzyl esterase
MQNYFADFIKTGNPNGTDLPEWKAAGAQDATPPVMVIDVESKTVKAENDARYLFLDKAYKNN